MLSEGHTKLITQIHESPWMAAVVITGGGSMALADLFAVPGASRTILEARIPYCEKSLTEFLHGPPAQAVSSQTAGRLAWRALERARTLRPREGVPVIGVACTAALVTERPKRGAHRIHVAVSGGEATQVYSLTLTKGERTREREERVAADLVLRVIAEACGVPFTIELGLLPGEEVCVSMRGQGSGVRG